MANSQQTYRNPQAGQALILCISAGCKTPVVPVKYSNLVKPFYYPNSQIPRYSVTCAFDTEEHKDFLKSIQTIEKNEKVDSILKNETKKDGDNLVMTGKILIKFQSKEKIPVYLIDKDGEKAPIPLELEDELAGAERIMIVYDILRYTKKNTMKTEHGLSFKPSCVYYYPKEG